VVVAINTALTEAPEQVNADAYAHWLYKLKPAAAADTGTLLDASAYAKLVGDA
jgi:glycine cleavage system H protein